MKFHFSVILLLILIGCFLVGCRAKSEVQVSRCSTGTDEIGVVFRSLDSLWSTYAERQHVKIEFYPYCDNQGPRNMPVASPLGQAADPITPSPILAGGEVGGLGAVKSIELSTEKTGDMAAIRATDSVLDKKNATTETLQRERASQARQDNGTVVILAIVAAVAVIVVVLIVIRKFFGK